MAYIKENLANIYPSEKILNLPQNRLVLDERDLTLGLCYPYYLIFFLDAIKINIKYLSDIYRYPYFFSNLNI